MLGKPRQSCEGTSLGRMTMKRTRFGSGWRRWRALPPIAVLTGLVILALLGLTGANAQRRVEPLAANAAATARLNGTSSVADGAHEPRLVLSADFSGRHKARPSGSPEAGLVPVFSISLPEAQDILRLADIRRGFAVNLVASYQPRAPPFQPI